MGRLITRTIVLGLALAVLAPGPAAAGKADVLSVELEEVGRGIWQVAVTVRHEDRDPEHWADWWRVSTAGGQELGRRILLHSHVGEQPFTRSERIRIPADVGTVVVEAHDKVHGLGGRTVTVDLSRSTGPGYTVKRRR